MEIKDIFLTILYLPFIYLAAILYRRKQTNHITRKYFLPALGIKIIGAISLGLIYQFYYGGGDTFNYFRDTVPIWDAFLENPLIALKIIFSNDLTDPETFAYTQRIYFIVDDHSFPVVQFAGFLSLFTFHTYTLVAIFFALFCFSGMWALYKALFDLYPKLHRQFAIAVFFIPSVFFWGSGLMKDTITLGALGWLFHSIYFAIIKRKKIIINLLILFFSIVIIEKIKVYILLSFLPPVFLWIFLQYRAKIKSALLRFISMPLILALAIPASYLAVTKITEENKKYKFENIAFSTRESAEWLLYVSNSQNGSSYSLGEFDGSIGNMLSKFPKAVFVTLYQPFLWQTRNPVMLLSAIEAFVFLLMTLRIIWEIKFLRLIKLIQKHPIVIFCLLFTLIFSFGVGVASYNFGTLVRYKIPMMPFFLSALFIIRNIGKAPVRQVKRVKKLAQFA